MLKRILQNFRMSKSYNFFFILCFSLGIIGLILVESFKSGVEDKVSRNAKNFIASDLSISARRQFNDEEKKIIRDIAEKENLEISAWLETYSLITLNDRSKLADLNFVDSGFPFYGGVTFEGEHTSAREDWDSLIQSDEMWMSRDLAWELNAKIGDKIKVGESYFVFSKVFTRDQFSSFRGFNLAPKVFLSKKKVGETKLMGFGSTGSDAFLFKFSKKLSDLEEKALKEKLKKSLPDPAIRVRGPKESSEQVGRSLNYLADYLGLITLLTYILSLIGLYYFTHHFLSKSLRTIAIYKALGSEPKKIFLINTIHLISLCLVSLLVSTLLMTIGLPILEKFLSEKVGETILLRMDLLVLAKVTLFSVVGCLLALLPIIFGAVKIPVSTVLQDLPQELKRISLFYYVPLVLYVILLSVIISHSVKIGFIFVGAIFLLILLGFIFFKLTCVVLEKSISNFSFSIKHGILALTRYFNSSFTIFMSLILGASLIVLIMQLEKSLRNEFTSNDVSKRPDLFIFDLQDDQGESFKKILLEKNINMTMFSPMIRARLLSINQEKIVAKKSSEEEGFETREEQNQERFRTRGVNLSYREKLSWSESLVKGKFFTGRCDGDKIPCEISLEESYARRMNVALGDVLTFDVSGVEISGKVTSLRKVKWTSFEPNFFILFQPGLLEDAPKTFLGSFKVKNIDERKEIFNMVAAKFPNASLLEVSEVIRKITEIFELMAFAIKMISYLSLFVALVVVWSVSFNHLELKRKEMALFYLMGLSERKRVAIYRVETFLQIFTSMSLAILAGSLVTYGILTFGFNILVDFSFETILLWIISLFILLYAIVNFKIIHLVRSSK